jgi:cell division protein FtsI/penicillin-binding protein 2
MIETVFIRLRLILLVFAVFAGVTLIQLLRIDFGGHNAAYFKDLAETISERPREFAPSRGLIYDRQGELLATNDVQYEIGLSPAYVIDPEAVAETLSDALDKSKQDIFEAAKSDNPYVLIARPVASAVGDHLKALRDAGEVSLGGVNITPIPHRFYPGAVLASQVLGFVAYNTDGRPWGYYGVEGFYNDVLAGRAVRGVEQIVPFDVQRDPTPDEGANLYLTIDRNVQALAEETLNSAMLTYGAEGGTILVLDPATGEILGMASWPLFDPNHYTTNPPSNPTNPAVSGQYEPGSTFKILTMAAALDAGLVKPDTTFVDTGYIEVGGLPIYNWNGGAWGPVDMTGCMTHSLNVCLAWLAVGLGPQNFYNYMNAFGIGHATSVDLAAENPGRLKQPGAPDWFESELGTNSFGQGVAVTPLQLVTAVSAVANGGTMMQPHILLRVEDGASVHTTEPQVLGRPIRPETAISLTQMLVTSLEQGEGEAALIAGYTIAGKTGTAQIPIPTGYEENKTIASFIGWGPADDPRFVALVKLDKPSTSIWGSETAAPLFGQFAQRLVVLMEIPPDTVRAALPGQ